LALTHPTRQSVGWAKPPLEHHLSAVDVDRLAGDVARAGTAQKTYGRRDFLSFAFALHRNLIVARPRGTSGGVHGVHLSRRDAVRTHALLGEFACDRAR